MSRLHHLPGLLFISAPCSTQTRTMDQGSMQQMPSEKSSNAINRVAHNVTPALLRRDTRIDAQKTKSLCCVAAGINNTCRSNPEALIPHERLRQAAPADTTLIASDRPHAQPAKEYKHPGSI